MALYYGRHKVQDYDHWRPFFDEDQEHIHKTGAKMVSVMRSTDDPNNVHLIFDIPDIHAFLEMLQSPRLQGVMQQAGVVERPVLYKLEELHP